MNEFKVSIKIPEKRIVGLFISACEGGSNYWCKTLNPLGKQKDAYEAMLGGFTLIDSQVGNDIPIRVTKAMIRKAMLAFPEKAPSQFADFMNDNDDAETGDVFLQLCTFGEVIYG